MRINFLVTMFILLSALGIDTANAQGIFENQIPPVGSNAPSYYYLGGKEGLTIVVNLWGFVRNPGRYEVPGSTDLVQLISLGGGPLEHAQLEGVRIVRQILQPDSTYKTDVIPIDLREFERTGQKSPLLLPGDTIIVPGSTFTALQEIFSLFRDVALVLSGVGTLILVLKTH
ncbi:MAG TPA: SLBB domain-containing protein [Candidatus Acidoferrales bacterium]|nr:SLBB domain-containing protein [Candidatus Acidoferrales bacterium]